MKKFFSLLIFHLLFVTTCISQIDKKSDTLAIKNGNYVDYHSNKKVKTVSNYKNNMLHGEYKTFYEDGKEESICFFVDGNKDGKWKNYYPNGKLKSITIFDNGSPIWMGKCDESGEMKMVQIFIGGLPKYDFFYEKGIVVSEGRLK